MHKLLRQNHNHRHLFFVGMLMVNLVAGTALAQSPEQNAARSAPHHLKAQEADSAPLQKANREAERGRGWRLAQDYERNGAIDRAAEIYLALFYDDPRHAGYYQGVMRTLTQLRRFDSLVAAIERRVAVSGDLTARADLGEAYYRKGDEVKARAIWHELLARYPQQAAYSAVGAAMVDNQLISDAVQVYLQGRRVLNQPAAFIFELAAIYAARLEYEAATEEYMRYLSANPRQLPFIQGKISELLTSAEAAPRIAASLTAALQGSPQPISLHRLLASVYLHAKDFPRALEAYKTIERLQATAPGEPFSPGAELFAFAERARQAEAFATAEEAYTLITIDMPRSPFWLSAQYGLAQTLQRRGRYEEALQAFQKIRARQPNSPWAMRAWFQEGEIYYSNLRLIDKAMAAYMQVYEKYAGETERTEAIFRLGDCSIAANDFARAVEWYNKARQRAIALVQDKATYRLARLEFYQGHFRQAQKLLDAIPSSPELGSSAESMVNDALEMQLLMDAHMADSSGALLSFARAELAAAQGRPEVAADTLQNLLATYPGSAICPLALFSAGQRYYQIGNYQQSLNTYQRLLKDHPTDMRADRALMRIAELFDNGLHDRRKAMEAYERLLTDYPKSLFLDEARQLLRHLSEKTPPVMN